MCVHMRALLDFPGVHVCIYICGIVCELGVCDLVGTKRASQHGLSVHHKLSFGM